MRDLPCPTRRPSSLLLPPLGNVSVPLAGIRKKRGKGENAAAAEKSIAVFDWVFRVHGVRMERNAAEGVEADSMTFGWVKMTIS